MSADHLLPIADGRTVWRHVWAIVGRRWWRHLGLIALLVAGAAAGIVAPIALGMVVDAMSSPHPTVSLGWWLGGLMAGAVVAGSVLTTLGLIAASRLFETMLAELRERMVETALGLPQHRVERAGTGDLVSRAGDDVTQVAEAIPEVIPAITGSLFTIVVTIFGMAIIDPFYALALLVILPVHIFAVRRYLRTAPPVYAAERAAVADRAQHLLGSLRGLESVRAYRLGRSHVTQIGALSWAVVRLTMRSIAIQNVFFARLNFAEFLGMAGLLIVGFVTVSNGIGTIGATTAAMLLFLRLFGPINQLLFVVDELQSALASLARIVGVITAASPSEEPRISETVNVRGVSHAYVDGHPVLHGIDLTVQHGETVAIVGASGAGKSTLAALIAGVHTPRAGDIRRPKSVILVTQETHIFDATLRHNLTLARPDASDEHVLDALGRVGAVTLLDRLAGGLNAALGSGGASVSAADAQHIALARVLLADPALVILDEATAEAGSNDANQLEKAAGVVVQGRTAIVIAHRLSQAAAADRIVLMRDGRIAEQGTHTELLALGGRYAGLWVAWSGSGDR